MACSRRARDRACGAVPTAPSALADRTCSILLMTLLALLGCDNPAKMRGCRKHWDALVHAANAEDEATLAERFGECADDKGLLYGMTLKNRKTGATVSFTEYEQLADPIVLTLSVGSKHELSLTWMPRRNANIVELMGE